MLLNAVQTRVLGALMEKEMATPEGYPLSLNSLILACNQRSSRDPVMELTEEEVRQALHALEDLGLTSAVRDSRVPRYEHRIRTVLNLRRDETALLCLLFLRGPQTPGELRSRSGRLHHFEDLDAVQTALERMSTRPADSETGGPLAILLARHPGSREARWAHLLSGPVPDRTDPVPTDRDSQPPGTTSLATRLEALEQEVASLRSQLDRLLADRLSSIQPGNL